MAKTLIAQGTWVDVVVDSNGHEMSQPILLPFWCQNVPNLRQRSLTKTLARVIHWEDDIAREQEQHQFGAVLVRGYTVKGLDSKYEDEYREFVVLRESVPSGTLYFSKFRPGSLREVILEERCGLKPRFVLDLIRHSKRNEAGCETPVLRARSRNDSFRMDIEDAFKKDLPCFYLPVSWLIRIPDCG